MKTDGTQLKEKIEYSIEYNDAKFFVFSFTKKFGLLKYRLAGIIGLGIFLLLSFILWLVSEKNFSNISFNIFLVLLVVFLLFILVAVIIIPASISSHARALYYSCPDNSSPMVMEIFDEALRVSKKYSRSTYMWENLCCCVNGISCICFYFDKENPIGEILPKSTMTQQQSENISEFLKEKLRDRYVEI